MAAQNAGLSSILILTGVTNEETADASDIKPTWRVRNYEELSKLVYPGWNSRVAIANSSIEALICSVQKQKAYALIVETINNGGFVYDWSFSYSDTETKDCL